LRAHYGLFLIAKTRLFGAKLQSRVSIVLAILDFIQNAN